MKTQTLIEEIEKHKHGLSQSTPFVDGKQSCSYCGDSVEALDLILKHLKAGQELREGVGRIPNKDTKIPVTEVAIYKQFREVIDTYDNTILD